VKGFILFLVLSLSGSAWAIQLEPILFGPEFNISKSATSTSIELVTERLVKHLIADQPPGSEFVFLEENSVGAKRNTLQSPNGWWFSWYPDGGIEFNMKPMTVAEYKRYKDDMQDAIFVTAGNEGYFPQLWRGGGHINIDMANFKKHLLLLRNFVVDLWNHNELFMGIFNYDFQNAKPYELGLTTNLKQVVAAMDKVIKDGGDFNALLAAHRYGLYGNSFNLCRDNEDRIELRGVRPQASMDVWVRQISLLESRIKYLATFDTLIPYKPRVPWDFDLQRNEYNPPIDPQEALKSFYVYVDESRQDWTDHRDYIWPQWTWNIDGQPSELEKFEATAWFKVRQARRKSEKFLGATGW